MESDGPHETLKARLDELEAEVEALRMSLLGLQTFDFAGGTYRYHVAAANQTWKNERAVELPIIYRAVQAIEPSRIIEVGNVLHHYFPVSHVVVDKYEQHHSVTFREDVVRFQPPQEYDLVVSISTLEHVGYSEPPLDLTKFRQGLDAIARWLAPAGRAIVTVPMGYNPAVDAYLDDPDSATEIRFLRRITRDNLWEETDFKTAASARYGTPFFAANAVAVIERRN
jgi:hypothetical protein